MSECIRGTGPRVWAVGGGKGGVGKSVISANLGVALARLDQRVVVFDADLGGANLHTLLGMPNPRMGLADFLSRRVAALQEVCVPTPVEKLSLISGSRALFDMANPKHSQKEKILRHIDALDADHVVLDIGAGSTFNTLDFFLFADRGILVVVPDPTSIENAYHFLKAAFYRRLNRAKPGEGVREVVGRVMSEMKARGIRSPRDLIENVAGEDSEAGEFLAHQARTFRPGILVNRVAVPDHRRLGEKIGLACRDYFGTEIDFLGCIDEDILVSRSVLQRKPHLQLYPTSPFGRSVNALAELLLERSEVSDDG